jgi:hypothetical protein
MVIGLVFLVIFCVLLIGGILAIIKGKKDYAIDKIITEPNPEIDAILSRILLPGEKVSTTIRTIDSLNLDDYQKGINLRFSFTNLNIIIFSESPESNYYERYSLNDIAKVSGWNEAHVYHFCITTVKGEEKKINFLGKSKKILINSIIPEIEHFINEKLSKKAKDYVKSVDLPINKMRENNDISSSIENLARLHKDGIITKEEFRKAKKKLIER